MTSEQLDELAAVLGSETMADLLALARIGAAAVYSKSIDDTGTHQHKKESFEKFRDLVVSYLARKDG